MIDLCHAINRRIFTRKNGVFQSYYSMEQGKIYFSSSIDSEKVILNDNMRDILVFQQNIINGKSAGSTIRIDCVIFQTMQLASPQTAVYCFTLYSLKLRELVVTMLPSDVFFNEKPDHLHHYNIKHLHYILVNNSYLGLCQLTLRAKLGDPLVITKCLAVITCHFLLVP